MTSPLNLPARIISVLFHPLLMATYLFSLFALMLPEGLDPLREDMYWNVIFLIFCATFVLPSLNISLFKALGVIKSFSMQDRKERIVPFLFIAALYIGFTIVFYTRTKIDFTDNLFRFLLVVDALVLISTIVTFFYRASIHSLAWWGMIGILLPLNKVSEEGTLFYPTIAAIVLTGVVMSARLQLQAHTPREILVGALLGLATSFLAVSYLF